jgi:hypothetical protein
MGELLVSDLEFADTIIGLDGYIRAFAATVAAASLLYLVIRWINNRL